MMRCMCPGLVPRCVLGGGGLSQTEKLASMSHPSTDGAGLSPKKQAMRLRLGAFRAHGGPLTPLGTLPSEQVHGSPAATHTRTPHRDTQTRTRARARARIHTHKPLGHWYPPENTNEQGHLTCSIGAFQGLSMRQRQQQWTARGGGGGLAVESHVRRGLRTTLGRQRAVRRHCAFAAFVQRQKNVLHLRHIRRQRPMGPIPKLIRGGTTLDVGWGTCDALVLDAAMCVAGPRYHTAPNYRCLQCAPAPRPSERQDTPGGPDSSTLWHGAAVGSCCWSSSAYKKAYSNTSRSRCMAHHAI